MSKLLWVDDNPSMTDGMVVLFELAGHDVLRAETATLAHSYINQHGIDHFAVIIIDVMLTGGGDKQTFSQEECKDYVVTGLVLTDLILKKFGYHNRKKLFLYSRATQDWVVRSVEETAKRLDVAWAPRNARMTPERFFSRINAMIR